MILNNAFEVSASPNAVFDFMMDPERVVPTIPGATFKGAADEDHWSAEVKASLGPMSLKFKGDVEVTKRDRENLDMALTGKGRELTGKGKASADISNQAHPPGRRGDSRRDHDRPVDRGQGCPVRWADHRGCRGQVHRGLRPEHGARARGRGQGRRGRGGRR